MENMLLGYCCEIPLSPSRDLMLLMCTEKHNPYDSISSSLAALLVSLIWSTTEECVWSMINWQRSCSLSTAGGTRICE